MRLRKFPILFAILILLISQFAVLEFVPSIVKAQPQPAGLPSIVSREYSYIAPHLVENTTHYVYVTDWGNYTFVKAIPYVCLYTYRNGKEMVSFSTFWINTTSALTPISPTVLIANNTFFKVQVDAYRLLTKVAVLTQTWDFSRTDKPKISVSLTKTTSWNLGDFNIFWAVAGYQYAKLNETSTVNCNKTLTFWKKDVKVEVGETSNPSDWREWLIVDWEDEGVADVWLGQLSIFGYSLAVVKVDFTVNDGQVDPSVVGTSTKSYATQYPFQRKSFYANGRFWVFYSDGTNMVYCTSTDGSTWTVATAVRAASYGYTFSVWFDGTYLHYAYASGIAFYYRRGTPNADGSITWSAAEQTVSTTYNSARYPMVSVDSNGYVWIGYIDFDGTNYYPYVIKSGNNDGTWGTTPSGFPYQLSTTSSSSWMVSVIPLTSGKMLVVYAFAGQPVYAQKWDGSAWGTVVATTSLIYGGYYSAVAQGDDVHLVFLKYSTYDILYTKYSYASNSFSAETTLQAGATSSSAPVISINPSTNDLYVFWAGYPTANHIYYRKYTASTSTWETTVDWIAETETLTGNDRLTCFYQAYGNYIGLTYMTKTASPYNVKFAYLSLAVADTTPPTYSNVGTNTTKAGQPCLFSVKWTDNVGLSSFIFGWNASGVWRNDTKVTLSGATAWSNVSKVLPLADAVIGWRIWCNDTSNNWNNTGIQILITSGALVQPIDTAKQTVTFQACAEEAALTVQTIRPSESVLYWEELSQSFQETSNLNTFLQPLGEGISLIIQTVSPTGLVSYVQEQIYTYPQTVGQMELNQVAGEGAYTLSQTLKPSEQNLYGGEGQNIMVQTITSTGSVKYWQEQQYVTVETAKTSSILSVLKEIAETFITQIDTVHLIESPFWLFEGPGGPPFVPPVPPVTPPIVPPVQPSPVLPYRYVPIVAGSIIAMAVIGIVAYEKSKPPPTSSRKVAAVWSKRQTENSKKAPPKIKRKSRFRTVE